jgi:hypothetical protein
MENIYITHDEQNNVIEAFGFKPEAPFITVSSSVWQQFAIYQKEDITIQDGQLKVSDLALSIIETTKKVNDAKQYLASTDYKMTVDYFATLTIDEQNILTLKRAESREFVRASTL